MCQHHLLFFSTFFCSEKSSKNAAAAKKIAKKSLCSAKRIELAIESSSIKNIALFISKNELSYGSNSNPFLTLLKGKVPAVAGLIQPVVFISVLTS